MRKLTKKIFSTLSRAFPTSVNGGRMSTIALQRHYTPRDTNIPSVLRSPNSRVGKSRYERIPPRTPLSH